MNKQASIMPILLAACGMHATAQLPEPIAPPPTVPTPAAKPVAQPAYSLTTSTDWQNPAALRESLGQKILSRLNGADEDSVKKFLASEFNRLLLANWMLAHAEVNSEKAYADYLAVTEDKLNHSRSQLDKLEKELPELGGESARESALYRINKLKGEIAETEAELRQPVRMADVVKRPRASRLITLMANDLGWLGDVVYSGDCIMPGRMLNMLANMMERYTRMLPDDRVPRDIATATAIEFARQGWTVDSACLRAEYFVRNWRIGRLHTRFDNMPFWLRRVVCGWRGNHSSGTPESFEWALNNLRLPDDRLTGSCWRCGYVLHNMYGDSIHGSAYHDAFEGMYTGRHHQFTQEVGGICGGLSYFGASAACAQGVPAMTMGEPEHCAFVVWVNDQWTPAYSLSWEHEPHWTPWAGNQRYAVLQMLTDLMSADEKAATRLSNAWRILAHLYASTGRHELVAECFLKAEAAQPLNYPAFREHADYLKATGAPVEALLQLSTSLCTHMVPTFAECAAELARTQLYDQLRQQGATAEQFRDIFARFWNSTRERGPERWNIRNLLNKQLDILNSFPDASAQDNRFQLFGMMLSGSASKPDYLTYALECGQQMMNESDEEGKTLILGIMAESVSAGGGMDPKTRDKALTNIIMAAESSRDTSAFQSVSRLISPEAAHCNRPIGDFEPFAGKLVSEGGVVYASSTSTWDLPATHANVLTKLGGLVHTESNQDAWIAVKLPKHATLSGVVLAAHPDSANWYRLENLQVQVSETGKADDWHNVGRPTGQCTNRIIRIDLSTEQPKALHVRVIRPGTHDVMHVDGFYVYGTPAA